MEEKKEKEKEETGETQKKKLVEKTQRKDLTFLHGEDERGKEREGQKENGRPRDRQVQSGRWLFLLLLLGQNWLCVNAAAEGLQRRTEMMERMQ